MWHEGGLHRVVAGREVRVEAAPGGVRVEPYDEEIARQVSWLLGAPLDLEGFWAWAAAEPVLAALRDPLVGYRPPLVCDRWEMLVTSITAQQVSLHSAFAVRSRLIERFGVRHGEAWAFPTRERIARVSESEIREVGFSTRKAEYVTGLARGDLDLDALEHSPTRRSSRRSRRSAVSAAGPPTGSSPGRSAAPTPGRQATSACARRCRSSTVPAENSTRRRYARWENDSGRGATSPATCCSRERGCTDDRPQRDARRPRRCSRSSGGRSRPRCRRRRTRRSTSRPSSPRSARSWSPGSAGSPNVTVSPWAWRSPAAAARGWGGSPTST